MTLKIIPSQMMRIGAGGVLSIVGIVRSAAWYVDSVNGSDDNNGLSADGAFATLAKVQSVALANQTINLVRGSTWREQLTLAVNGVTVQAYGTGARPIIDARDVVAAEAWSKTGGQTNVYQADVTFETGLLIGTTVRPFDNDTLLTLVASVAACDATANTYYIASHTVSPQTIYIHTSDNSDPAANGRTYTVTSRASCLYAQNASNINVTGIYAIGSLAQVGVMSVGNFGVVTDCYLVEGEAHNAVIGTGVRFVDCVIRNCYTRGASAHMITWNTNTPNNEGISATGCTFEFTSAAHPGYNTSSAIYSHFNVSGSFGVGTIENCTFINIRSPGSLGDCASVNFTNCTWTNCKYGVGVVANEPTTTNVVGGTWTSDVAGQRFFEASTEFATFVIDGVEINASAVTDTGLISIRTGAVGSLEVKNCVVASSIQYQIWVYCQAPAVTLNAHHNSGTCAAGGWAFNYTLLAAATGMTFTSDYNTFSNWRNGWYGAIVSGLTDWRAASSQDAHSS